MDANHSFGLAAKSGPIAIFEAVNSNQPNPITQLLEQISALRDEFDHEREKHKSEHKELRDKYAADLQLFQDTKNGLERDLKQLQEKYKEDLTRTLKKVEYLEGDWKPLQTRASGLRSEVDSFKVAATVQGQDTSVDEVHQNTVDEGLTEWQVEKTELIHRQKILEDRLVAQESDSAQLLQQTQDGLESIIVEYYETTKKLVDRKSALGGFQLHQMVDSNGPRPAHGQDFDGLHPAFGQDIASSGVDPAKPKSINGTGATVAGPQTSTNDVTTDADGTGGTVIGPQTSTNDVTTNADGTGGTVVGPQISINDVTTDAHTISVIGMPQSANPKPPKRTLSELLNHERDGSSVDYQRRRTGFAKYVGLSNPAWQEGATSATASNGFASVKGDLQPHSALGAPSLLNDLFQHEGSKAVWGDMIASLEDHTAVGPDFATTKVPLETSSSLTRALVSLPPSRIRSAAQR